MHIDEYEISLSRELSVCKSTIKSIKAFLSLMERKHNKTTKKFIEEFYSEKMTRLTEDCTAWLHKYESLQTWEELQRQYEEMFRIMRI